MTRILLIRHGATDSAGKILAGRTTGVHLNAEGLRQIQQLGRYVNEHWNLAAIVCSPLERTVETARALDPAEKLPFLMDDRFSEFDFGEWTGKRFDELNGKQMWAEYNRYRSVHGAPGGEGLVDVQARAWKGIRSVCDRFPEATVAVVSHADVIRSILLLVLGMPLDNVLRLDIQPASVSEIRIGAGEPMMHCMGLLSR